jgi:ABC-type proline/glycine betaine transport system ATPase subunit
LAHRIALLDEGRIAAIGTPDEIKCNPDLRVQRFLAASLVPRPAVSARRSPVDKPHPAAG